MEKFTIFCFLFDELQFLVLVIMQLCILLEFYIPVRLFENEERIICLQPKLNVS